LRLKTYDEWLAQRTPDVRARILRFQPTLPENGARLRGWRPTQFNDLQFMRGDTTRGAFIRKHGRDAWASLPAGAIRKMGRRQYVTRCAMVDFGYT
jgi:hypothetical protein